MNSISTTCLVTDSIYTEHLTGLRHPESPKRYTAILEALSSLVLKTLAARDATLEQIAYCHTASYIQTVVDEVTECSRSGKTSGNATLSTGDVQISPLSLQVAVRAAGGVLTGIDAVMQGVAENVFCLIRPPGHHAMTAKGMGFCLFNNIAIGARYAQLVYGIKRVLIVDWDVHHGNGTQEIFYTDPSVFYFSTHEWPLYPGTGAEKEIGEGAAEHTTLNCPIEAGSESRVKVLEAFRTKLVPAMRRFRPELVLISAGFDAHRDDPLGSFNLSAEDFAELTGIVKQIANRFAQGRIVSVLEGGYNLKAISAAAKAHVTALMAK